MKLVKLCTAVYIAGTFCMPVITAQAADDNVPKQVMSDTEVDAEWNKLTKQLDNGESLYAFAPTLVFSDDGANKQKNTQVQQTAPAPQKQQAQTPKDENISSGRDEVYIPAAEKTTVKQPEVKTKAQIRKEKRIQARAEKAERARQKKELQEEQRRREAELQAAYEREQRQKEEQVKAERAAKAEQARLEKERLAVERLREVEVKAAEERKRRLKEEAAAAERAALLAQLEADRKKAADDTLNNIVTVKDDKDNKDAHSSAEKQESDPAAVSQEKPKASVDERFQRLLEKYYITEDSGNAAVASQTPAAEPERSTTVSSSSAPAPVMQDPFRQIEEETAKMKSENQIADERRKAAVAQREAEYERKRSEPRIYPKEDGVAPNRQYGGLGREIKFSGLTLQKFPGKRYLVKSVTAGSIADRTGFRFGDRLISINKDTVGKYSTEELMDILSAEQGNDATFIVLRDQQTLGAIMRVMMP